MTMYHQLPLRTPIEVDSILYLQGDSNYTSVVFTNGQRLLLSKNIASLLTLLPETLFLRLSKTHAVNTTYLDKMHLKGYSRYAQLNTGQKFEISRRRASEMRKAKKAASFFAKTLQ
ncbi:hypothetical protein DR864_03835 [Runella rosea]|uniref:HTH LytTR-type domain-containing protein n=2 Tax=Runella rosea TaxID=2259595 RepID=A0A344TE51_9BACT|nr:hypothetical protein DR864_03835 [Runella rosea]